MRSPTPTPAAQYLRMSTEHQQYSLANQAAVIEQYAEEHGFQIVQSYSDAGQSGLTLRKRGGLSRLLADVLSGETSYRAVLVYDISRWGRFQDSDESAHYEFVCKAAGVHIHYCAEPFLNDGALASSVMKSLKRALAGQFSRELSEKVSRAKLRIAAMGFRVGGAAGYGLRRMLVSSDGVHKRLLGPSELKGITTDRVILVPGPNAEVRLVRAIYRMLLQENKSVTHIVRQLNAAGQRKDAKKWTYRTVHSVLTNPKYIGCNVCGRTSQKLGTQAVPVPEEGWVKKDQAFRPIIDSKTFEAAQRALQAGTLHKTDQQLIDDLKRLLSRKRAVTSEVIADASGMAGARTYFARFGSLARAYELAGFRMPAIVASRLAARLRIRDLRRKLQDQLVESCGAGTTLIRSGGNRQRACLRLSNGITISVVVARSVRTPLNHLRWSVCRCEAESHLPTLLCRCTPKNDGFLDFYLLPLVERHGAFRIKKHDTWLRNGCKVNDLADLPELASRFLCGTRPQFAGGSIEIRQSLKALSRS